jgi:hypothetical protein
LHLGEFEEYKLIWADKLHMHLLEISTLPGHLALFRLLMPLSFQANYTPADVAVDLADKKPVCEGR